MTVESGVAFGIEKSSLSKKKILKAKLRNKYNIFADENA